MNKPCATCKYFANGLFEFLLPASMKSCSNPAVGFDPVTGKLKEAYARLERSNNVYLCGPQGRNWEVKE